jgi:hypothetical protein
LDDDVSLQCKKALHECRAFAFATGEGLFGFDFAVPGVS